MGLDAHVLDSGCCGMAGSFGFEAEHDELSQKVGERVILPAVRQLDDEALVVADGFSCRTPIAQGTARRALHFAQVVLMALREGPRAPARRHPERAYVPEVKVPVARFVAGAAVALFALVAWRRGRRLLAS